MSWEIEDLNAIAYEMSLIDFFRELFNSRLAKRYRYTLVYLELEHAHPYISLIFPKYSKLKFDFSLKKKLEITD